MSAMLILSLFLTLWVDIPKVLTAGQMVELLKDIKYCCLNRQLKIRKQILD